MTRRAAAAIALIALAGATLAGCAGPADPPPAPELADVTVHDPSVVTSDDRVWIFGSHGASAHSSDLIAWTQHTVDLHADPDNALFGDVYAELAETFEWAQTDTLWAADVIELPDGRYAMYYNACKGDSPRSALGLAIADTVDGPYVDQGILLRSGMWDQESENPGEMYDATVHPNAVDPDAFYDADGAMWMVYGSYSGGIFILEMNPATGLPLEGQGYGTHLLGGNHARIEGPTVQYAPETGYYYLYVSFGGLDASGGYEVRVFRSEHPGGPYVDAQGNPAADVAGAPGTVFDDASIEPYGVKILGGYEWADAPAVGVEAGYVSPGHNSWYRAPETGATSLVFHSRFPGTGEMHQVRVHRTYLTVDGWPVVSPGRYAGEASETASPDDLAGTWQAITFDRVISPLTPMSAPLALEPDGNVSGVLDGTWTLEDGGHVTIETSEATFTGVAMRAWNPTADAWTWGISVLTADGTPVWARKDVDPS
ncbi:glycoside hydrolase family 43 protein [Demequina sp. SYSU T00039]|uniref:Glycoside hydrolase family 43 protein n=1 Tax=Demequina lignilytica TaxID=3051663 RepID=A0AAW7M2E2_9MICO|nr:MULTISPECIES: glycoside hydrolase family 43 protein [unclassified Demequina]MDN4478388.1 glycoside hydrolase family 43 protein [Demequina sp. SYSU T00039-1]MDN4487105.1 glycoside hydrolase family 43 protein [Demequina sp. SYSU T00039]MDN4489816.1 glycoside hydrolase family 43 protein [Demequina sp. SYSU T00068]